MTHPFPTRRSSDLGIIARKSSRRGDAGQFGQADRNGRILGVIQLVCNLHRLKTGGLFQIRLDTIHLVRVEREQIRERSDRSFLVMQRSEEHTSELQSLMRISYAVFCLKKKT